MPFPHPPPPRFSLSGISHTRVLRDDVLKQSLVPEELLYDVPMDISPRAKATARPRARPRRRPRSTEIVNVSFGRRSPLWGVEEEEAEELAELLGGTRTRTAISTSRRIPIPFKRGHSPPPLPSPTPSVRSWLSFASSASSASTGSLFSSPSSSPSTSMSSSSSPLKLKTWLFPPHKHHPVQQTSRVSVPLADTPLCTPPTKSTPTSEPEPEPSPARSPHALTHILSYAKSLQEAYVRAAAFSVGGPSMYDTHYLDLPHKEQEEKKHFVPCSPLRQAGYRASKQDVSLLFPPNFSQTEADDGSLLLPLQPGPPPFTLSHDTPPDKPPRQVTRGRSQVRSRSAVTKRLTQQPIRAVPVPPKPEIETIRPRVIPNPVYLRLLAVQHLMNNSRIPLPNPSLPLSTSDYDGPRFSFPGSNSPELTKMCSGREKLVTWGLCSPAPRTYKTSRLCQVV